MARIEARAATLDMREALFHGEVVASNAARIDVAWGERSARFDGEFSYNALGQTYGLLTGFSLRLGGALVFQATEVERYAATAVGIALTGDNDRFLAYVLSGGDVVQGSAGSDVLLGFGGDDRMFGRRGDDEIFGGSDDDRLYGGAGDDLLAGGAGADRLYGGVGDDTYIVDAIGDRVVETRGSGWDVVLASATFVLPVHVEELGLTGSAAISGRGNDAANVVRGNRADNGLRGMDGDDVLSGLAGDDVLVGGRGRDLLSGGYGDDVYRFQSLADSGASRPDKILDFWSGEDRIDLAVLDADAARAGDQAFVFIGTAAFSGRAGELRVSPGRVLTDVDGDRDADSQIDLAPLLALQRDDFIL